MICLDTLMLNEPTKMMYCSTKEEGGVFMTVNKESLFWKTNKEWYRINYEKDCYELTDKAPERAKASFELYKPKRK